jgi:hypothetical protein
MSATRWRASWNGVSLFANVQRADTFVDSVSLFFSTWPFRLLYSSLIMTVIETIMRDIQSLSLRQQVEVARYVQRLSETARGGV